MKVFWALFLGGFVGTIVFLIVATLLIGDPFGDWFLSAHGILVADKQKEITEADNLAIYRLLSRGLIISSDSIISNMTDLYGNMIQVLIGVLAVATIFAFFAVRWQSIQAAEEFVDHKTKDHFASTEFRSMVKTAVEQYVDTLDPATNPQVNRSASTATMEEVDQIKDELKVLVARLSTSASAEEPEDIEMPMVAPVTSTTPINVMPEKRVDAFRVRGEGRVEKNEPTTAKKSNHAKSKSVAAPADKPEALKENKPVNKQSSVAAAPVEKSVHRNKKGKL